MRSGTLGLEGMKRERNIRLKTAAYAESELQEIGIDAWRNPQAFTVVFPQPAQPVREKWQLASANGFSHLICMPHVRREQIDELIADIRGKDSAEEVPNESAEHHPGRPSGPVGRSHDVAWNRKV